MQMHIGLPYPSVACPIKALRHAVIPCQPVHLRICLSVRHPSLRWTSQPSPHSMDIRWTSQPQMDIPVRKRDSPHGMEQPARHYHPACHPVRGMRIVQLTPALVSASYPSCGIMTGGRGSSMASYPSCGIMGRLPSPWHHGRTV